MAQSTQSTVEQFMVLAPQLITEAAEYAGSGVSNPAADANIRQLRTMNAALQAALMAVNVPMLAPQATAAPSKA